MRFWWYTLLFGCLIFFGALVFGLRAWRFSHFPHAVATITDVWDKQIRVSRGRGSALADLVVGPKYETITMGRIQFERSSRVNKYDCTMVLQLGVPTDGYRVGEKLDVVPATGTCQRVDVIGRVQ
ncbi:hypothetical protein QO004_000474 [Rhizobium mesoamericanum]|uniref:hypothetical protein n=1 Tax=Rhizobium mesoamericanum TaxID=1079800 RepID=UPI00278B2838|nr:hypothetical protein [Rhizobium mesoamericanum]MDQ0558699.1 hypothetical protein [Rhizobium mesoamericanum]